LNGPKWGVPLFIGLGSDPSQELPYRSYRPNVVSDGDFFEIYGDKVLCGGDVFDYSKDWVVFEDIRELHCGVK